MANLERAEASDLDVLLFLERFLDRIEERVDDAGAVLLGDHRPGRAGYLGGHALDQIGYRHGRPSEGRLGAEQLIELTRVNSYVSRAWRASALPLSHRFHELLERRPGVVRPRCGPRMVRDGEHRQLAMAQP